MGQSALLWGAGISRLPPCLQSTLPSCAWCRLHSQFGAFHSEVIPSICFMYAITVPFSVVIHDDSRNEVGRRPHTALRSCTCDIVFLDGGTEISQMVSGRCCGACSLDGEGEKADFSSFPSLLGNPLISRSW